MTFGENLKQIRTSLKLTQDEAGIACELAFGTFSQYETDNREPTLSNIKKLSEGLECSYLRLLDF